MTLNQGIRKVIPAELPYATINYDYFDISEGTGIVNLYAAQCLASGAVSVSDSVVNPILTTDSTLYSSKRVEKVDASNSKSSHLNYDIKFNKPQMIKGIGRVTFSQGVKYDSSNSNGYVQVALIHYDGITETVLASGASVTLVGSTNTSNSVCINMDMSDQIYRFKKDEILRLAVHMYSGGGGANGRFGYGCDPANRDDIADASGGITVQSGYTTQLKVQVPFIIDI